MNFKIKDLSLNALIGALYITLVYVFQFLSFDAIQFRVAEALLILVLFNPKLSIGLILANALSNIFSPLGMIDVIVGTTASTIAIILMIIFRKKPILSLIFPAISNGIIIGIMLTYLFKTPFIINLSLVFLGEFVVMYLIGLPLYYYFNKHEHIKELLN